MFYIADIVDNCTHKRHSDLRVNESYNGVYTSPAGVKLSSLDCSDRFVIAVFDSSDSTTEYYTAKDLIRIYNKTDGLEIKGLSLYSGYYFRIAIKDTSKEALRKFAKDKLVGKDYINEANELCKVKREFINGDTLIIPDGVESIGILTDDNICREYCNCSKIKLPDSFNLNDNLFHLGKLANYRLKKNKTPCDNFIITDKDVNVSLKFVSQTMCCVMTTGKMKFADTLSSIFKRGYKSRMYYSFISQVYSGDDVCYLSFIDKDSCTILDFKNDVIR